MDLKEIVWESTEWIHLAQDRDQWQALAEHSNEPLSSIKKDLVPCSSVSQSVSQVVGWLVTDTVSDNVMMNQKACKR
jgi:hypothetical protein